MIDRLAPVIAILLMVTAALSWAGLVFSLAWISAGCFIVATTRSRGFLADLSLALTYPLWLIAERDQ